MSMAESAANGGGFLYHGQVSHYPQGYPALLAVLMKLGVFHVWAAVFINFVFLALGLWAVTRLFPGNWAIVVLTLLSFVTIKHYTIPLTDLVFFGIAMLCLLALERGRPIEACILVLAAIATRRNGIALAPPLLWVLYQRRRILIASAIVLIALTVRLTSTLTDFHNTVAGHTMLDSAIQIVGFRFLEFGELAANLPGISLPQIGQAILPYLGALAMLLIAACLWSRRRNPGPCEIFFVSYTAILFVWPYYDPRFWLPVLPLFFAYALREWFTPIYLMVFSLIGALVLAVSIHITYSGKTFPDAYGNAQFRPSYCAYYKTCPFDPQAIDADGLHLLQTYH